MSAASKVPDIVLLDLCAVKERLFGDNRLEFSSDVRFLHGALVDELKLLREAIHHLQKCRHSPRRCSHESHALSIDYFELIGATNG
jgi:hypothetical protein